MQVLTPISRVLRSEGGGCVNARPDPGIPRCVNARPDPDS